MAFANKRAGGNVELIIRFHEKSKLIRLDGPKNVLSISLVDDKLTDLKNEAILNALSQITYC